MADKLRVGVIGCGSMTSNHTYGYLNSGRYEVVALSDLSPSAMTDFDEKFSEYSDYKPEHFADAREMLAEAAPEIVSIGVWHKGHSPMTIAAAAAGGVKAILCEKPMADSVGAAAEMLMDIYAALLAAWQGILPILDKYCIVASSAYRQLHPDP